MQEALFDGDTTVIKDFRQNSQTNIAPQSHRWS